MNSTTTSQTNQNRNQNAETLAHWLDDRFEIPGTDIRFGLDPIISLVPGAGDWTTGLVSSYFILLGAREEVPSSVLARMGFNVLIDILIGSIPLLGDIFDFGWKANTRNAELLKKYQENKSATERRSKWLLWTLAVILLILIIGALVFIGWLIVAIVEAIF